MSDATTMITKTFEDLVQSFAAKTPTPGGGAAAAMSACLGTALFLMAIRFSRGKKSTLEFDDQLGTAEAQLSQYLDRLKPMAERDCASFDHVSTAYGLPKETDAEKSSKRKTISLSKIVGKFPVVSASSTPLVLTDDAKSRL